MEGPCSSTWGECRCAWASSRLVAPNPPSLPNGVNTLQASAKVEPFRSPAGHSILRDPLTSTDCERLRRDTKSRDQNMKMCCAQRLSTNRNNEKISTIRHETNSSIFSYGCFKLVCGHRCRLQHTSLWAPSGRSPRAASMSALLINKFGCFAAWLSHCC